MKDKIFLVLIPTIFGLVSCGDRDQSQLQTQVYEKVSAARPAAIPANLTAIEPCSLDAINDQLSGEISVLKSKANAKLTGWAGNIAAGTSSKDVWLEFVGTNTYYAKVNTGLKREDVASFFKKPNLVDVGWEKFLDFSPMTSGMYKLNILMKDDQQAFICDPKRSIQID